MVDILLIVSHLSHLFHKCNLKQKILGLPWSSRGWESAFQCRGHRFDPWSGSWDPTCHGATQPTPQLLSTLPPPQALEPAPCRGEPTGTTETSHRQISKYQNKNENLTKPRSHVPKSKLWGRLLNTVHFFSAAGGSLCISVCV